MKRNTPKQRNVGDNGDRRQVRIVGGAFWSDEQAQTLFDFVIGITLFLMVVMFTFMFVPDLIDPFQPSPEGSTVLADRGADHLTQNVLHDRGSGGPYVLSEQCVIAFFNPDSDASTTCNTDHNDLHSIIGMEDGANVNVQIVDETGVDVVLDDDGTPVSLNIGDNLDEVGPRDIYSATRVVSIDGDRYELIFRVW